MRFMVNIWLVGYALIVGVDGMYALQGMTG
jgi:hypothetical protein